MACTTLYILAIAAASTGVKSVFSRAKEVTTNCRSRLNATIFEQIECLNYHWKGKIPDYARINEEEVEELDIDMKALEWIDAEEGCLFADASSGEEDEDGF